MVSHRDINRIDLLKEIGFEFPNGKGAEIGTFKGEFAKEILQNWSGTLYMIDVWRPLGEEYLDSSNHATHSAAYSETMGNISGYEDRGIMVRATSEVAADMFERESLNFVYIDANHAYDFVVQDIKLWYPKVKSGGYLCGHDYINIDWYNDPNFLENKKDKHIWNGDFYHGVFGVNPAVDEFCKKFNFDLTITKEWFGSWMIKK
jgi:cephalosporin hydroxylase